MPIACVRFMPEELANIDDLWLLYDFIEQARSWQAKALQQPDKGDRRIRLLWLDFLTARNQEIAAGIVVSTLRENYMRYVSLYKSKDAAPLFSEWLCSLAVKYRDIFDATEHPDLRDIYLRFGPVLMKDILSLVNKWLSVNEYNIWFDESYLEPRPLAYV